MWNSVFIVVHASAATIAFIAGVLAVPAGRFLAVYRSAMICMAVALVLAVSVDWTTTDRTARIVYTGLLVLAVVMVVRSELAVRHRPSATRGPTVAYLDHLGFTLISLADGFAVVTAIRLAAPGWVVAAVAVGVVLAGEVLLSAAKRRCAARPGGTGAMLSRPAGAR